jgi:hypothetical protein
MSFISANRLPHRSQGKFRTPKQKIKTVTGNLQKNNQNALFHRDGTMLDFDNFEMDRSANIFRTLKSVITKYALLGSESLFKCSKMKQNRQPYIVCLKVFKVLVPVQDSIFWSLFSDKIK